MKPRGTSVVLRRLLGRAALLALAAASMAGPAGASAATGGVASAPSVTAGSRYLALGDSVTFGYEEGGVVPAPQYKTASSFIAFPEILGRELHLRVANASCPGETTASLINPSSPSNGCENAPGAPHSGYRTGFPLHVHYRGSQLSYAVHYLRGHRDVRLVSLMIGANDGFVCIETTEDACTSASEMAALKHRITHNVRVILHAIRHRARYRGQLVIVNYYSPFKAYDPRSKQLNAIVDSAARPFGVRLADGFGVFRSADSHSGSNACTAGLLTQLGKPGDCGIHPSYAGQSLLAQAVERAIRIG